jgi:hypothetical protein
LPISSRIAPSVPAITATKSTAQSQPGMAACNVRCASGSCASWSGVIEYCIHAMARPITFHNNASTATIQNQVGRLTAGAFMRSSQTGVEHRIDAGRAYTSGTRLA